MDYYYTLAFLTSQVAQIIMNSKKFLFNNFHNLKKNFRSIAFDFYGVKSKLL